MKRTLRLCEMQEGAGWRGGGVMLACGGLKENVPTRGAGTISLPLEV